MKFKWKTGFKMAVLSAVVLTTVFMVFKYTDALKSGIRQGLYLCGYVVIPSLFVFTAISLFISSSGLAFFFGKFLEPLSSKLFALDGEQFSCFILSLLSGYPTGARLISNLYERGRISAQKARLMLLYCINAGPAFIVTAVGVIILNSNSDGVRLLIAHILSSIIMAAIVGIYIKNKGLFIQKRNNLAQNKRTYLSDSFVESVSSAAVSMFYICGFVILFSGIGGLVDCLPISKGVLQNIKGFLEVTVGIQNCTRKTLEKAAFLLGFGGLSVMLQVMSAAKEFKPSFFLIFLSRIVHGVLSAGIVAINNMVFPRTLQTVSLGEPIKQVTIHTSPFAAAALVFLSIVLICYVKPKGEKML